MDPNGFHLSGLLHLRVQAGISGQLVSGGEAGDIPDLAEDYGAQHRSNAGDGGECRVKLREKLAHLAFQQGSAVLKGLELIQVQQKQCGIHTLAVQDTEAVPGEFLELPRFPLSEASVAGGPKDLRQFSKLRSG